MIALIIFIFGDLCIFYERFIPWFIMIIFVLGEFCIFKGRRVDVVAKPPWFHWLFFLRWIWQLWTCHLKTACEKSARKKTAVPILQVVWKIPILPGSKTSQNCRWSMQSGLRTLECQCVASSGTVFGALWFCPAPEHFYSRNPFSKTSLVRQGCSTSYLCHLVTGQQSNNQKDERSTVLDLWNDLLMVSHLEPWLGKLNV